MGKSQMLIRNRATTQPHTALRYGGASPVKHDTQSIAGTTAEARRGNSGEPPLIPAETA